MGNKNLEELGFSDFFFQEKPEIKFIGEENLFLSVGNNYNCFKIHCRQRDVCGANLNHRA